MEDTITIKLPHSGKAVVIRNYTTEEDDQKSEALMYEGVEAKQDKDGNQVLSFSVAGMMAAKRSYIDNLVISIDGASTNIPAMLLQLRSVDYAAIREVVEKIVEEHSPKANEASKASKSGTSKT